MPVVWYATRGAREEHGGTPEQAPSGPLAEPTDRVTRREVATADGGTLSLPAPGAKATVLVFTSTTCPIAIST